MCDVRNVRWEEGAVTDDAIQSIYFFLFRFSVRSDHFTFHVLRSSDCPNELLFDASFFSAVVVAAIISCSVREECIN